MTFRLARCVALLLLLVCSGCRRSPAGIEDIIPTLVLKAGIPKEVAAGDLFFSDRYEMMFEPHPAIETEYQDSTGLFLFTAHPDFNGLTLLSFRQKGEKASFPVFVEEMQEVTFLYTPRRVPRSISVFGSFNDWNRLTLPMTDEDGDGTFEKRVPLENGTYEYKFFIDGEEIADPGNPEKLLNPFGSFNSVCTVRSARSEAALHVARAIRTAQELSLSFVFEGPQPFPGKGALIALFDNHLLPEDRIDIQGDTLFFRFERGEWKGEHTFRAAVSGKGYATPIQTVELSDGFPRGGSQGFRWSDAVLYAIMTDRFLDGDPGNTRRNIHPELDPKANFHGGDLQGILLKLEEGYFDSLGVNTLWISPVNQNTRGVFREYPPPHRYYTAYHGYWPIDPYTVDDRFGDLALFKKLVRKAHESGMYVLLDYVAHHVHEEHPFYAKHPEWFGSLRLPDGRLNLRFWDDYRLTTWFEPYLPTFNYAESDEALEAMTDNAVWWLKKTGIDGFRQDAVKHIPNRFWRLLSRKMKQAVPRDLFQIGETFGSYELISSYVNNGQLDSQFNFNLYETALRTFLSPEGDFRSLDAEMKRTFRVYGVNHMMGNLMDSHDKVRYMAYADGDLKLGDPNATETGFTAPPEVDHEESYAKALLYMTYLVSIPGIPVLYYGDEIGMTGAADPDNRRPMRFGPDLVIAEKEMLSRTREIVRLRMAHSALRLGDFCTLAADKELYAFMRSDFHERIIVVLNKSTTARPVSLLLPSGPPAAEGVDLVTGRIFPVRERTCIVPVEGVQGRVILLR